VALPLISSEFQIPPALEGLMLSAFFWSYALMQIPGGMLLDRFQTRRVIVIATVAWGAFQALAAGAHNWITLLITRMGLGVAESPIMPAGAKLNGAWLTPNDRGRGAAPTDRADTVGQRVWRDHHRRVDRLVRLLAHRLCDRRRWHHARRRAGVEIHPQPSQRTPWGQRR